MSVIFKIKELPVDPFKVLNAKQPRSEIETWMNVLASSLILDVVKQHFQIQRPTLKERIQRREEALEELTRPDLCAELLSFLPYDSLLNASLVSKRFRAAADQLISARRQQVFSHFTECFTLSIARRILDSEPDLNRSTELYTCSFNNPLRGCTKPRKLSLLDATPDLLDRVRHSGSMFALSTPLQQGIGIQTLEGLKGLIATFPDHWLREITGLDLKGFDLTQPSWFEDLKEIMRLCPELTKVQFYSEDFPNELDISMLNQLNQQQHFVKIRVAY